MELLKQFTPDIENYSIDEAFLNFTNTNTTDFEQCGLTIKKTLQKGLSMPACIGFGPSKTLSKVANRITHERSATMWR